MNLPRPDLASCARPWLAGLGLILLAVPGRAESWELPSVAGNVTAKWSEGSNVWQWDRGNPFVAEGGAEWLVARQAHAGGNATDEYTPLKPATLFKFTYGWGDDPTVDYPPFAYFASANAKDRALVCSTTPAEGFPQTSPAAAVLFKAPKDGSYRIEIEAKVTVQSKAAGHARITLDVLSARRSAAAPVAAYDLNNPGGEGGGKEAFSLAEDVSMKAGDELTVRVATVSPGLAGAGRTALSFGKFTITLK